MAKKKPAAKMPKKAAKAAKKPAKTPPKKKLMTKKAPAKKAPAKKAAPAKKSKSLVQKVVAKVKTMTKEQLKALKAKEKAAAEKEKARLAKEKAREKAQLEKERAREKALAAKEKEREAKEKAKQKELEKKQKEKEKLEAKAAKEREKLEAKKRKEQEKEQKRLDKLREKDPEAYEAQMGGRKPQDGDDEDEFLEYAKKSKGKGGKSKYDDDDVQLDIFEGKGGKKYKNAMLNDLEAKIGDEIAELREHFNWKEIAEAIGTMDFFIDAKNDECIEKGCDNIRTTQSYCRLHYLRNWKTIQKKRDILKEGKLQEYIEELISKYPPKYIEALLSDLSDDKEFYTVLNQLNITSEFDFEEDEFENAVDDDDNDDDIGIETISSSLRYEDE